MTIEYINTKLREEYKYSKLDSAHINMSYYTSSDGFIFNNISLNIEYLKTQINNIHKILSDNIQTTYNNYYNSVNMLSNSIIINQYMIYNFIKTLDKSFSITGVDYGRYTYNVYDNENAEAKYTTDNILINYNFTIDSNLDKIVNEYLNIYTQDKIGVIITKYEQLILNITAMINKWDITKSQYKDLYIIIFLYTNERGFNTKVWKTYIKNPIILFGFYIYMVTTPILIYYYKLNSIIDKKIIDDKTIKQIKKYLDNIKKNMMLDKHSNNYILNLIKTYVETEPSSL